MDPTATLASIAAVFHALSDRAVEDNLVVFDALLNVSDTKYRPVAAQILSDAAAASQAAARRDRLLKAAADILAGEPCAFTPEGLSARQAAAASTVTVDQVVEPPSQPFEPPEPFNPYQSDLLVREVDSDEDEDDAGYMEQPPPKLPHLPVRHFFRDIVLRVGQNFADAQGTELLTGTIFQLMRSDREEDGTYVLVPLAGPGRRILLNPVDHAAMIENAGNAWLQPVPSAECLIELCYWIGKELTKAEDNVDEDDDDFEDKIDRIDTLRGDVQACRDWLEHPEGDPPKPGSAALAARIFGRDRPGAVWIKLLYAAIAVTSAGENST